MNCQELHAILDIDPREKLTPAQRQETERHFASCRTCREVWAVYRELVAEPIPPTSPDLQQRVAAAIDAEDAADAADPKGVRRVRRFFLAGSVLIAGAVLAKTLSLGLEPGDEACSSL